MVVNNSSANEAEANKPISLKPGVMIGPTNRKNWLTFGGLRSQIWIPDQFSIFLTIVE